MTKPAAPKTKEDIVADIVSRTGFEEVKYFFEKAVNFVSQHKLYTMCFVGLGSAGYIMLRSAANKKLSPKSTAAERKEANFYQFLLKLTNCVVMPAMCVFVIIMIANSEKEEKKASTVANAAANAPKIQQAAATPKITEPTD